MSSRISPGRFACAIFPLNKLICGRAGHRSPVHKRVAEVTSVGSGWFVGNSSFKPNPALTNLGQDRSDH